MSNIAAFGKTCVHAKSHHKEPHLYGAIDGIQLGSCTIPVLPEGNNGESMFLRELPPPFMILFEITCMPQARTYIKRQCFQKINNVSTTHHDR